MVERGLTSGPATKEGASAFLLRFDLDGQAYGLPLAMVERAVRAVAVTPLPGAPGLVRGVINLQGQVVPVMDVRRRFGLDSRPLSLSDHMIVARGLRRTVVLLVDSVVGTVAGAPVDWVSAQGVVPGADDAIVGVVRLSDGLLLIHDLDRFLSAAEEEQLAHALAAGNGPAGSHSPGDGASGDGA
ncbi:chemotaxis protein CheW [Nitrospirillum sp. BR 11164]|uniref:chemotaxis protein CheW n=1 Tax=Nitrospirillum sp. BR 11164 TaxID=3104324 RepID=UPI002AFFBFFD|nr:chemotaxis protein CheW [Nitrospirillum sp. BR 11164]MEA1652132.1 chemotaxis protein CheW [Nitrospirillum sp. BR 11164]